jgi:hypothetical protein
MFSWGSGCRCAKELIVRSIRFLLSALLVPALVLCCVQAQTGKDKKDKAPSARQVYLELMAFFDQKDASRDGYWSKEEIISAYGLPNVNQALGVYDGDKDGRISRAEYDDWAKENADDIAAERADAQREYEEAVKKLQAALAKANKEARERIQKQIQEARERFERRRDDRNDRRRDLDRRDRRRDKKKK